ncbi:AraC family transcriptional regulator [Pseudomonas carassii]|uniref:Helix-turn-helix transcriptional regulator n=1 Tax=Pseudomonas carassii TaxID=3115855 RepID=A0ABU7HH89_9PSED|nr:helix-turn-helix transcriptional regulator [Pseudomonas sp. 137P]MEE1890692.1 helix-turn-helix transcriptional regulator [Pseudomonas sp. 137P]
MKQHLPVFEHPGQRCRPVCREYADGQRLSPHWHEAGQLVFATRGIMELRCAQGFWVLSPQQGLWVPAGLEHSLRARGQVSLRTLYLHPQTCELADQPYSLLVTPLLRELLLSARAIDQSTLPDSREAHLMALLLDELRWVRDVPLRLAMPAEPRLQKLCAALLEDPANGRALEDWGHEVGASVRTLARLFQAELGCTFQHWRQQARVFAAIARLHKGEPVGRIAQELGYESPAAFAKVFRRLMGCAPSVFSASWPIRTHA